MFHSFLSIAPLHQLPNKNILQRGEDGGVQGEGGGAVVEGGRGFSEGVWETTSLYRIPGFCHAWEFVSCQRLKPIDNMLSGMRGASTPAPPHNPHTGPPPHDERGKYI